MRAKSLSDRGGLMELLVLCIVIDPSPTGKPIQVSPDYSRGNFMRMLEARER
jgi:hypothetical protein